MKILNTIFLTLISLTSCSQSPASIETLYQNGALEELTVQCQKVLSSDPENLMANHLLGRSYVDTKQFNSAIPHLEKVVSNKSPKWMEAWSMAYLGICYFNKDDYTKSVNLFENVIKLDATKNATKFARKKLKLIQLRELSKDWETHETAHFVFYFQPDHDIPDLESYCQEREDAFEINNRFFETKLSKKIDYFIWNNAEKGKSVLGQPVGFANSDLAMINSRINQTLGHELTHIICDHGIKPTKKNRFINEGIAVAFDLTLRNRFELAKKANSDKLSIKAIFDGAGDLPESLVYPVGGAFIEFLLEAEGAGKLKKLAKNQSWENLVDLYGKELIEKFETLIK